ncbi:MAG: hypothetical protein WDN28_19805 [Chthoniobacter sp.]
MLAVRAQNCEWRIDRKTGAATCLGVINRDSAFGCARFGLGENGHVYLVTSEGDRGACPVRIFERLGDGDYKLRGKIDWTGGDGQEDAKMESGKEKQTVLWFDKNGDGLEQPDERVVVASVLDFNIAWTMPDLTLHYGVRGNRQQEFMLKVVGWTECGARALRSRKEHSPAA